MCLKGVIYLHVKCFGCLLFIALIVYIYTYLKNLDAMYTVPLVIILFFVHHFPVYIINTCTCGVCKWDILTSGVC